MSHRREVRAVGSKAALGSGTNLPGSAPIEFPAGEKAANHSPIAWDASPVDLGTDPHNGQPGQNPETRSPISHLFVPETPPDSWPSLSGAISTGGSSYPFRLL
jgi:hypothetical protein